MLPDAPKLMKRARRAAKSVQRGELILEYLEAQAARDLLIAGADKGIPPVSEVAPGLLKQFGSDIKQMPVKTFIGLSVRAILAEENYELVERGVRTDPESDPVFRTGAVYEKVLVDEEDDNDPELVDLLTSVASRLLNDEDRHRVIRKLKATL